MSNDKRTFTIGGTSTFRGKNTFRFATGSVRGRSLILKRNGHIDIKLVELPQPMTKAEAVTYLQAEGFKAVMPKTGRGSGITLDEMEAHQKLVESTVIAAASLDSDVAQKDASWLANLGK